MFSLFFTTFCATFCYFSPPSGWQPALPKESHSPIEIGFVGQGGLQFAPSLNIAFEEVDVSLKEYVKAVKEIHVADPTTRWRDLGPFKTEGGTGRLVEISSTTPLGEAKILQLLYVEGKTAYILTGAALKEEFPKYHKELLRSFHSFRLLPTLFSPLSPEKQAPLEALLTSLANATPEEKEGRWGEFQAAVAQEAPSLGTYWHFLSLREGKRALEGKR